MNHSFVASCMGGAKKLGHMYWLIYWFQFLSKECLRGEKVAIAIRDCHGFEKPTDKRHGLAGVGVRVGIFKPWKNPYP